MTVLTQEETVSKLQQQLSDTEKEFDNFRGSNRASWGNEEWQKVEDRCNEIRGHLYALTGDYYGKLKVKKVKPSEDLLEAEYETPWDVPKEVMDWIQRNTSLLFADATDAVRWSRIINTLHDERYLEGDLTIYRAVVEGEGIRPGDWVTMDLSYAKDHLSRYLNGKGQIYEEIVDGRDILVSPTGNFEEAIYAPRQFSGATPEEFKLEESDDDLSDGMGSFV